MVDRRPRIIARCRNVAPGLQSYGGAIAEVPEQDTAFSLRDTAFEYGASSRWTDPVEDDRRIELARRTAAPSSRSPAANTSIRSGTKAPAACGARIRRISSRG
jgi:hypothetical protein